MSAVPTPLERVPTRYPDGFNEQASAAAARHAGDECELEGSDREIVAVRGDQQLVTGIGDDPIERGFVARRVVIAGDVTSAGADRVVGKQLHQRADVIRPRTTKPHGRLRGVDPDGEIEEVEHAPIFPCPTLGEPACARAGGAPTACASIARRGEVGKVTYGT